MPSNFLTRLKNAPVLCDGAMGTLLYSKGIFINRCYDELSVSQPELIRNPHHEYLQAGALVIVTNSFGTDAFRFGLPRLSVKQFGINLLPCLTATIYVACSHYCV